MTEIENSLNSSKLKIKKKKKTKKSAKECINSWDGTKTSETCEGKLQWWGSYFENFLFWLLLFETFYLTKILLTIFISVWDSFTYTYLPIKQ